MSYFCTRFQRKKLTVIVRGVAQLASALAWGARGRKFESFHPDNFSKGSLSVSYEKAPFFICPLAPDATVAG